MKFVLTLVTGLMLLIAQVAPASAYTATNFTVSKTGTTVTITADCSSVPIPVWISDFIDVNRGDTIILTSLYTSGASTCNTIYNPDSATPTGVWASYFSSMPATGAVSGPQTLTVKSTAPLGQPNERIVYYSSAGNGIKIGFNFLAVAVVAPGTPGTATAVAGNASATVTPVAPATGGTPTSYLVTASPGGATCTVTLPATSCNVTGLTNGTSYTFTTTATNAGGTSSSSSASLPVTPIAPPGVPGAVTAVASNGSVTVTPTAPSTGGAPSSYVVTASPGGATCTVTVPATSCTITGLTNGTSYTFTSTAVNGAGTSSSSAASPSVTPAVPVLVPEIVIPPKEIPQAPSESEVNIKYEGTSVIFTITYSGGELRQPDLYSVRLSYMKSCLIISASNSCTISNLRPGFVYSVSVRAENRAGTSQIKGLTKTVSLQNTDLTEGKRVVAGFAGGSAALTADLRAELAAMAKKMQNLESITCTGYTTGPVLETDKALAISRARAVCSFLASRLPNLRVELAGVTPGSAQGSSQRKVVIG